MTVVDLNGKEITEPVPAKTPLTLFKDLVRQIEAGELVLEQVYVIGSSQCSRDTTHVVQESWDSGITAAEAVFLLESHKYALLRVLQDMSHGTLPTPAGR